MAHTGQRPSDPNNATPLAAATPARRQGALDIAAAGLVTLLAVAMVVRPLPNLDLYWLMAVGRRIVETGSYIYEDPFTFTVPGTPWSPLSYLSGIIFYGLFKLGGMGAIGLVRMVLVGAIAALTFRTLRRIGVAWAVAAPLVLVALFNAHTRLTDRGQIFEYVFVAWLVGFLLSSHERRGASFFIAPVAAQLAWVQLHSSFLLGPALAAIFFLCEWVAPYTRITHPIARHDWKRAALLVALMALACCVNPNPKFFLLQPFDPVQRDLMSKYTLEWKSPFDPTMMAANFHPYYDILLVAAAAAVALRLQRLPLAPVALMAATMILSLQSHRLRVEFALVAVPMIALLLRDAPLVAAARRFWPSRAVWGAIGVVLVLSMAVSGRDRLLKSLDMPELYPREALAFVEQHGIANRPYSAIGFGSYMLWDQYGKRPTFIDGRNFDPVLFQDFLAAQTRETIWRAINRKYKPDAYILPVPERGDQGLRNLHMWLQKAKDWPLVYRDEKAFVYVAAHTVDPAWLESHRLHR